MNTSKVGEGKTVVRDKILQEKLCEIEEKVDALRKLGYDTKRFSHQNKVIKSLILRGSKAAAEQKPVETRILWDKATKLILETEKKIEQLLNKKTRVYEKELEKLWGQLEKRVKLAEKLGLKGLVEKEKYLCGEKGRSGEDFFADAMLKKDMIQKIRSEISRVDRELTKLERRALEIVWGIAAPNNTLVEELVKNLGIDKSSAEKLLERVLKQKVGSD